MRFNLDNIAFDFRNEPIYYIDDRFIAYRDVSSLVFGTCDGQILSRVMLPIDYLDYQAVELDTIFVFLFGQTHLILINKINGSISVTNTHQMQLGRIITPIIPMSSSSVLFGAQTNQGVHILHYNVESQNRIFQTYTQEAKTLNSLKVHAGKIYAVTDQYMIHCYNMSGEVEWHRYEMDKIRPGIAFYNQKMIYVCHKMMKMIQNKEYEAIPINGVIPTRIWDNVDNKLVVLTNNNKNLCQISLNNNRVDWEIPGTITIQNAIITDAISNGKNCKCIITMIKNYVGFVNASEGTIVEYSDMSGITSIRTTKRYLLAHKQNQTCAILESRS